MTDVEATAAELCRVREDLAAVDRQLAALSRRREELVERRSELEERVRRARADDGAEAARFEAGDFPWSPRVRELLGGVFRLPDFRPLQQAAVNATLSGRDCLLVLPTGAGKSLCFQLPALVPDDGFTLVVSPLVALIHDQLLGLRRLGVAAAGLDAASTPQETRKVLDAMAKGAEDEPRLVYVTPEKLAKSKRVMSALERAHAGGRLRRVAIDEVHCCSAWGHDFRPDYKFLGVLRRQFPGVPILGLTATASARVLADVEKMLGLPPCLVLRGSYNRRNLFYEVLRKPASAAEAMRALSDLIRTHYAGKTGIVYCLSQKDSEEVAAWLRSQSIKAACYHANLHNDARSKIHVKWVENRIHVVVATIAFGMGIDKADVRFVIHYSPSKSLENYYQESGRAGRDDADADCVLLFRPADAFRLSSMVFPERGGLANLYAMLRYCLAARGCRREMVARHFGEAWAASDCASRCDLCAGPPPRAADLGPVLAAARAAIAARRQQQQRPTGARLVEGLLAAPRAQLPALQGAGDRRRDDAERCLLQLVVDDFLAEEFHFTPFNTISYVVAGARAPEAPIPFHLPAGEAPTERQRPARPTIVNAAHSKLGLKSQQQQSVTRQQQLPADEQQQQSASGQQQQSVSRQQQQSVSRQQQQSASGQQQQSADGQQQQSASGQQQQPAGTAKEPQRRRKRRPVVDEPLDFGDDLEPRAKRPAEVIVLDD